MSEYLVVPLEHAGLELDEYLCLVHPGLTKGFVRREVREGRVLVDAGPANPSQRLRYQQVLTVDFDEDGAPPVAPVAPMVEVPILHEDHDVMVMDKPAGLAVEPERWHRHLASLSGALLKIALERDLDERTCEPGEAALSFRPRLVHRIDKDTSGCVVVAKHLEAERALRDAWDAGRVRKSYLALVEGEHPLADGESELIDLPLASDERKSGRMRVQKRGGKASRTRIVVEERYRGYTLLACEPLTGRTHQIRVHLAASGFPLAVDPFYGRRDTLLLSEIKPSYRAKRGRAERPLIDRLTLHAREITFPLPGGGGELRVEAPLPKDFERTLKQVSKVRAPARSAAPDPHTQRPRQRRRR